MKNIIKIFTFVALAGVLITACGEEPYDMQEGGSLGAIMYPEGDIPFLFGVTTDVTVNLNPFANEGLSITSINVTKMLTTASGASDPVTIAASGTTFTQSATEMFADVPVGGVVQSENTLTPGDYWTLSYTMSLSDGRTMSIGDETTITFQCLSEIAGSYTTVGSGGGGNGFPTFPGTFWDGNGDVTLTEVSGGVYSMDKAAGGFYAGYWGGDDEVGTMRDVCGVYTIDSKTDQWGYSFDFQTVVNNGDGSFTVSWTNGYGDFGTYTATPQ